MIKEVYTQANGEQWIYDFTYDANENLIKEVCNYSDGHTETMEMKYRLVYIPFDLSDDIEYILDIDSWF